MRNFGRTIKMMIMALAMGALFCSCNAAGGSDYCDSPSSVAASQNADAVESAAVKAGFKIVIPRVSVEISGPEVVSRNAAEAATFTADATEGAVFAWYVNGMLQSGENGSTYELSCAYPGVYEVACIAMSANGAAADSASMYVTVNP